MKRLLIPLLALCAALTACASLNPFSAAHGADEKAYAVLGAYQIYQKQALKVASDASMPAKLRLAVADADKAAVPVLRALDTALTDLLDAKAALAAGTTDKEKVAIALANLLDWTARAQSAVTSLKNAVSTAKKTVARTTTATPYVLTLRSA